jgi:hypothetical protein
LTRAERDLPVLPATLAGKGEIMKAFLIGMLYSGENEYADSIRSVENQSIADWDLLRFENLPNKEAHDALYRAFMARADEYRFFLKLDADTVLRGPHALATLQTLLDVEGRDTLIIDAHDWISNCPIPAGMQAYSNRVRWPVNPDLLMVDHTPIFPGTGLRQYLPPAPLADHSPNPSAFQAFRYGVHRAMKAIQPDRRDKDLRRAVLHWSILKNIWRAFREAGDARRLTALLGAEAVLSDLGDRLKLLENYSGEYVRNLMTTLTADPEQQQAERLERLWQYEVANDQRWLAALYSPPWIERRTQKDIDPAQMLL